jgi:lipoprotein-anchoring transpeptidase ErfK/SrfK
MGTRRRTLLALAAIALAALATWVGTGGARLSQESSSASPTAVVVPPRDEVELHTRPSESSPARTVPPRTPFGSRRVLPVLGGRGPWLRVLGDGGGSNAPRWIHVRDATRTRSLPTHVVVDLSDETLFVMRGTSVVAAWRAESGRNGTPTPPGAYAITDKLRGARFSAAYGCCILALNGRQDELPAGWGGGDRLAIHGTPTGTPESSIGCVTLADRAMHELMGLVRRGTVVKIRP